jgi:hypothetical protein
MQRILLLLTLCLFTGSALGAEMPVNLSIWYPLSLNKDDDTSVNFNLSIFRGKVGSVKGLDMAGLTSTVKYDLEGIQLSGLVGVAGEDLKGLQLTGLVGVAGTDMIGVQFSGLANVVGSYCHGFQVSGFTSVVGSDCDGIQLSGFAGVVGENLKGLQNSGFASIVGDDMKGIQLGGFANIVGNELAGIQVGGFTNVVGDDLQGLQVSGFANITGGEMKGLQVGCFNVAGHNTGIQIGLINVAEEQDGIPIGMVLRSHDDEDLDLVFFGGNLTAFNAGAKFETNNWYSMLSVGFNNLEQDDTEAVAAAWHFGRHLPLDNLYLDLDFGVLHIDNGEAFKSGKDDQEALQGRLIIGHEFRSGVKTFAGGGLTWLSRQENGEGVYRPHFMAGMSIF